MRIELIQGQRLEVFISKILGRTVVLSKYNGGESENFQGMI
jgi:hypothetical protein